MPRVDLSEDRAKMRDLARRMQGMDKMDWGANAAELMREKEGYPRSAYCPTYGKDRWGVPHRSHGLQHYVGNPTKTRKTTGTRRIGTKRKKMPTRATCSGCHHPVVLVDNTIDPDWPLFIGKLTITEWP